MVLLLHCGSILLIEMIFFFKLWLCSPFSVFPNVCAHLVKVGNNHFPFVQTKFGKDTILGGSTQFWSQENTNRKFGIGRSDTVTVCV